MTATQENPRPTPDRPARWIPMRDVVLGDLIVTNRHGRGSTGRVTHLIPQRNGKIRVFVDNCMYYPHVSKTHAALILR